MPVDGRRRLAQARVRGGWVLGSPSRWQARSTALRRLRSCNCSPWKGSEDRRLLGFGLAGAAGGRLKINPIASARNFTGSSRWPSPLKFPAGIPAGISREFGFEFEKIRIKLGQGRLSPLAHGVSIIGRSLIGR
jgi:hypothetical protein